MTAREKLRAARDARSKTEDHIRRAVAVLGLRTYNGEGIYVDRWEVQTGLVAAIDELKKALRVVEASPSIGDADYAAADRENAELAAAEEKGTVE